MWITSSSAAVLTSVQRNRTNLKKIKKEIKKRAMCFFLRVSAVVWPRRFTCFRHFARIIGDFRFARSGQLEISVLPENVEIPPPRPRKGKQTASPTHFTRHVLIGKNLHPRRASEHQSAYSRVQQMKKNTQAKLNSNWKEGLTRVLLWKHCAVWQVRCFIFFQQPGDRRQLGGWCCVLAALVGFPVRHVSYSTYSMFHVEAQSGSTYS